VFDKISRSWSLAGECWDILMEAPALLIFPLLSSLAIMVLLVSSQIAKNNSLYETTSL
jgi:hypothetical protein